jgi:hypothetical protein
MTSPAISLRDAPKVPSAEQLYHRLDLLCEGRLHPQLREHDQRVRELAAELGLVTGEAAWRRFAGFAILGAYAYPYASSPATSTASRSGCAATSTTR